MRDTFPFFDVITLPTDAGPNDSRIEFDGLNGEIRIYENSTLVGRWNSVDFRVLNNMSSGSKVIINPGGTSATQIIIDPPNSSTFGDIGSSQIFSGLLSADDTPLLGINGPKISTETGAPRIDMYGSNSGGSTFIVPVINIAPNAGGAVDGYVDIPDNGSNVDFKIGGRSTGRGKIAIDTATSDDGPHSTDFTSDLAINNVPLINGRSYRIHCHAAWELASVSAAAEWQIRLQLNGSNIDRFDIIQPGNTGTIRGVTDSSVIHVATATGSTDDFAVFYDETVNGADITLLGTNPRYLLIEDIGV